MRLANAGAATMALASVTLLAASCAAPPVAKRAEALPFIEDDFPRAVTEARARKLPIFADSWAPW